MKILDRQIRGKVGFAIPCKVCGSIAGLALVWFSVLSAGAATYNGASAQLDKFKNNGRLTIFGDSSGLLVLAGVMALGTLGFFAYLYWREWNLDRVFREYREQQARQPAPLQPAPREPLIRRSKPGPGRKVAGPTRSSADVQPKRPAEEGVRVNGGATLQVSSAPQAPRCGTVNVTSENEPEEIFLDGECVGVTPARLTLSEGKHLLELRREGVAWFQREITAEAGREVSLRVPNSGLCRN